MGNDKNNCLASRSKNCFGGSYRTPQPIKHFNLVKFWFSTGTLSRSPDFNRPFFIYTLLRIMHANGARFFFICLYIHIGRGLYYGSYYFMHVWSIGVIILFAVIAAAFLGYVLP